VGLDNYLVSLGPLGPGAYRREQILAIAKGQI